MADRPDTAATSNSPPAGPGSPFRLDLEQQRKRAKELKRALLAGDPAALHRVSRHHPQSALPSGRPARLSDAQLVIARELGLSTWPKLKVHVLALDRARAAMADGGAAPDGGIPTLHIRCGADLTVSLRTAGFAGDVLEYADPLCQGPLMAGPDWLDRRAAFLAEAYGPATGRSAGQIAQDLDAAEHFLGEAAGRYGRIVLWLEHDSYDQLVLARCLAQFAKTRPRQLELISVDRFPATVRFIGLGQLPPEALRLLWTGRQAVSTGQLLIGRAVWDMLRQPDPRPLAVMACAGISELPHLGIALRRHCQELPGARDGLGLTERLVLQLLSERPRTVGDLFRDLAQDREPLPWLGDIMLLSIVDAMRRAAQPVFTGQPGSARPSPGERFREGLTITGLGRAVLAGDVDWLSLAPPERWLGGVHIPSKPPCWRWDDRTGTAVLI